MIAAIYAMGLTARRWPRSIAVYGDDGEDFLGTVRDGQVAYATDTAAQRRLEAVVARAKEVGCG